jgi:hypothetical protein
MSKKLSAVFCADEANDLVVALRRCGYAPVLAPSPEAALETVPEGGTVFLLADAYPCSGPELTATLLAQARSKGAKLYIEYPACILDAPTEEPQTVVYERLVAPDGFFGSMEPSAILMLNECWYRAFRKNEPGLLCLAKVAGYDTAVYGLPESCCTELSSTALACSSISLSLLSHFVSLFISATPSAI